MKIAILSIGLVVLAACAATPINRNTISSPATELVETGSTYVMVTLETQTVMMPQFGFCPLDGSGTYTVEALGGLTTCTRPSRGVIAAPLSVFRNKATPIHRMTDGTLVVFAETLKRAAIGWSDPSAGRYALVGQRIGLKQHQAFGPDITGITLTPGAVHYIGHVTSAKKLEWRDPEPFLTILKSELPYLQNWQIVAAPPSVHQVTCSRPGGGDVSRSFEALRRLDCSIDPLQ